MRGTVKRRAFRKTTEIGIKQVGRDGGDGIKRYRGINMGFQISDFLEALFNEHAPTSLVVETGAPVNPETNYLEWIGVSVADPTIEHVSTPAAAIQAS
jgi:hypothetical protein